MKYFGCNKVQHYRNKCPSRNGRDRELQEINLLQIVDDIWTIDSGNES